MLPTWGSVRNHQNMFVIHCFCHIQKYAYYNTTRMCFTFDKLYKYSCLVPDHYVIKTYNLSVYLVILSWFFSFIYPGADILWATRRWFLTNSGSLPNRFCSHFSVETGLLLCLCNFVYIISLLCMYFFLLLRSLYVPFKIRKNLGFLDIDLTDLLF